VTLLVGGVGMLKSTVSADQVAVVKQATVTTESNVRPIPSEFDAVHLHDDAYETPLVGDQSAGR